jgi:hypothetical protein
LPIATINRMFDPNAHLPTLGTMVRATRAIGATLSIRIVP